MSLFAELKRRNVFRMGGAYLALGWVVTQVTATVAPALGMPEWTLKLVVWLGIIGFPLIVAFAWAYELTPEGIQRESELPPSTDTRHASGRRLDYITIGMIAVALLFFVAHSPPCAGPRVCTTGNRRCKVRWGARAVHRGAPVHQPQR